MKIVFILLFIILSFKAFACRVDAPAALTLYTDLELKEAHYFKDNVVQPKPLAFSVNGCDKSAQNKKVLMMAIGAEQFGREDAKRSISFTGEYNDDKCTITDSPLPVMPFADKFKAFKKKNDYLKKCLEISVKHQATRPISYSANQNGCIIKKISDQEVVFQGGLCFFKPFPDSSYDITINIKEACRSFEGLADILQGPQELNGAVNFYIAGDDTGSSTDLTALKSTPFTISINPLKSLMPLSADYSNQSPRWPGQWVFPEIFPGKILITPYGTDSFKLQTPLFVDHQCAEKCVDGVCSSPCQYSIPVAGEFVLKELEGQKETYLTSWFDGGFAPAKWQGIINGQGVQIAKSFLQVGKRYKIEFNLLDPKVDFEIFKNRIKKKIAQINSSIGGIGPGETIGTIRTLPEISSMSTLPEIGSVNSSIGNPLDNLTDTISALNARLGFGNWPPLYEEYCSANRELCKRSISYAVKFEVSFDILSSDGNGPLSLGNFQVKRMTPFQKDYDAHPFDLPRVSCE